MKRNIFLGLIFTVVIVTFLVVAGWFSAQCDISKWAEILVNLTITIIGAFLGFITALRLDKLNEKRKTTEAKKGYIKSLYRDIDTIKDNLNSIIQKDNTTGEMTFQSLQGKHLFFELPIWEAMVSTGEVNLFNDEDFFDDICKLSAKIKTLNNIENNIMIMRLVNTKPYLDKERKQKLEEIYGLCDNLEKILTNRKNDKT